MKTLSDRIFDLAARAAPGDRAEWISAMRTELEFAPPAGRLRFASGCVAAALVWRVWTPQGVRGLAQSLVFAGSAALALVATHLTFVPSLQGGPPIMAIPAVAYAFSALAAARWGLRGVLPFAACGIAISAALLLVWATGPVPSPLIRALALEGIFILAGFLSLTVFARVLAERMERSA